MNLIMRFYFISVAMCTKDTYDQVRVHSPLVHFQLIFFQLIIYEYCLGLAFLTFHVDSSKNLVFCV